MSGFGIVQARELEDVERIVFEALCDHVSRRTGIPFRLVVASSYRELASGLERGELGLAWLPPSPTIAIESRGLGTVLAIPERNGSTTYHSALVVRSGGPRTLAELEGKRAAWVERESASGYIVPRMHLVAQGIDVLHYFKRELFVLSHAEVLAAVESGDAEIGATYCQIDAGGKLVEAAWLDAEGRPTRPLETFATIGPIPNDALIVWSGFSSEVRTELAAWILDPPEEARPLLASAFNASMFRAPTSDHYAALKQMVPRGRMA